MDHIDDASLLAQFRNFLKWMDEKKESEEEKEKHETESEKEKEKHEEESEEEKEKHEEESEEEGKYLEKVIEKLNFAYSIPEEISNRYAGMTALHFAAKYSNMMCVRKLIDRGFDIFQKEMQRNQTPLHLAAHYEMQRYEKFWEAQGLLKQNEVIVNLLAEQMVSGNSLNCKTDIGLSHLHIACIFNHEEAVEFLIDGKNDSIISGADFCFPGYTALHFAVRYSSVEAAKVLLTHGVDMHAKNDDGVSPVHLLISRLLDAKDFVNMGKQECCLTYHREIESMDAMIALFLQTSPGEKFVDDTGLSAFHLACCFKDSSFTQDVLGEKFDINTQVYSNSTSWPGWTPLHFVACLSPENFKFLLSRGADINLKNIKGESPLGMLMARYSPDVIHAILSTKDEFKKIFFSDESTNLLDTLLLMNDCNKFNNFLQTLPDVNISIPSDSPLFPGYTLIHLAVSLCEKKNFGESIYPKTDSENELPPVYNCTKEEEMTYWKRIVVCLSKRCSLTTKNSEGLTPIHLAFNLGKVTAVENLINCCEEDSVDLQGLSHLHIACAVGNENVVKRFLNNENVNNPVRESFGWYGNTDSFEKIRIRANSTPLHLAVIFERYTIVEYLLDNGANIYDKDAFDLTPLHLSIAAPHTSSSELAELILVKTIDIRDSTTMHGLSHLHVAAYANCSDAVKTLIQKGADSLIIYNVPTPKDRSMNFNFDENGHSLRFVGQTPLEVAVSSGCVDAVREILSSNVNIYETESLLTLLFRDCNIKIIECFMRKCIRDKRNTGPINSSNVTALHFASAIVSKMWTREFLELGADVNAQISFEKDLVNWKGFTPLQCLIDQVGMMDEAPTDFKKVLELLLKHGADVTIKSFHGDTPLHDAFITYLADKLDDSIQEEKKEHKLEFLLNAADLMLQKQKSFAVNPANMDGFSHFHYACFRNNVELVQTFLDNGVNLNLSTNYFSRYTKGYTPLHFACMNKATGVTYKLLKAGADCRCVDSEGNTPLHLALKANCMDERTMDLMFLQGMDINAKNIDGVSIHRLLTVKHGYTEDSLRRKTWIK